MRELTVTEFFNVNLQQLPGKFFKACAHNFFFWKILMAAWNKTFLQARTLRCSFIVFFKDHVRAFGCSEIILCHEKERF